MEEMVNPCYCCEMWFPDHELTMENGYLYCVHCLREMQEVELLVEELSWAHDWKLEGF